MLRSTNHLKNCRIHARDGTFGKLSDLLVDDETWNTRYLVIDTGGWLKGRRVLISPGSALATGYDEISVELTKDQIRNSPPVDADKPVSRQHEADLHNYYGWAPYWGGYPMVGLGTMTPAAAGVGLVAAGRTSVGVESTDSPVSSEESNGDPHLRSVNHISSYGVEALDGNVGHLKDLMIDDNTWIAKYAIVDTTSWWPGGKVAIAINRLNGISWADRKVSFSLTREAIKNSPAYNRSAILGVEYSDRLDSHYSAPL